ncbi:MAG TPA: S8 family serine peptidase [Actinophytocola sp.]|uniref:S8 family peptidase n=1 Tax=Actinophytocola sp. TaxID=1872138 RepID=UPI002DDD3F0A|nr:S8 family serine peptidase [Actinophytocola sp.]HEV2782127.1 S8 family serine peptidase [Actinophytocola sp.]
MEIRLPAETKVGDGTRDPASRGRVPEFLGLPADVLVRHRARLLDPSTAVVGPSGRRVESTVYRADTLLLPLRQALLPDVIERYNKALEPLGFELKVVLPDTPTWCKARDRLSPDLQIPILLLSREDRLSDRAPDPWAALVALRRSMAGFDAAEADVDVIELEHLVAAAAVEVGGAPFGNGSVASPFGNGSFGMPFGNGSAGLSLATGARNPVRVFVPEPKRCGDPKQLPAGRRPVVAVLDTGIGDHPWLTLAPADPDPVIEVSEEFQTLLSDQEAAVALASGAPEPPRLTPFEERDVIQPLLGLTDSVAGHGTFVAGLVFQNCPDARILSLRVLHTDGIGSDASVLLALEWLHDRHKAALTDNRPEELIDVVSLSLGFYPEASNQLISSRLARAVKKLTDLGVAVVAAAGNDATTRPFVPAAMALNTDGSNNGNELLVAVGALNASGRTVAAFSNEGDWVTCWAPGNAVVSTVPLWEGAEGPDVVVPDPDAELEAEPASGNGQKRPRTGPDNDDLRTGFAVWAGTSFATPVVAGILAGCLADRPDGKTDEERFERARAALAETRAKLAENKWHN